MFRAVAFAHHYRFKVAASERSEAIGKTENFKKFTMNKVMFIEYIDNQWIIHWLGIPYLVESSFRGRFYNVLSIEEESIDLELEGIILDKFFKMKGFRSEQSERNCL